MSLVAVGWPQRMMRALEGWLTHGSTASLIWAGDDAHPTSVTRRATTIKSLWVMIPTSPCWRLHPLFAHFARIFRTAAGAGAPARSRDILPQRVQLVDVVGSKVPRAAGPGGSRHPKEAVRG